MSEYVGIVVTFVLAGALVGAFIALASTLGPKMPSAAKSVPFECGQDPFSLPIGHLSIKFYLTAILFILFDVELVFLYPLAVVFRDLGMLGSGRDRHLPGRAHGRVLLRLGQRRPGMAIER